MNTCKILISCDPASAAFALEEVNRLFVSPPPVSWLDEGIALLPCHERFASFSQRLDKSASIFIRHLAPVQLELDLKGDDSDLPRLAERAQDLAFHLDAGLSYSVQSRILGEGKLPYRRFIVNQTLSDRISEFTGAIQETRAPQQIVSVLCTPTHAYLGLSQAALNRSPWPGGAHRFQREEGQISRAEFKLLEALSLFPIALPQQGLALDMGAAPGGWTRVLRQRGMNVIAVDPADLDPGLIADTGVTHSRMLIQDYLEQAPEFDLLVNDMRMDAKSSVEVMLMAYAHLRRQGSALLTLKLREEPRIARNNPVIVAEALDRLASRYHLLGARQLYHNRSEVTVALCVVDPGTPSPDCPSASSFKGDL